MFKAQDTLLFIVGNNKVPLGIGAVCLMLSFVKLQILPMLLSLGFTHARCDLQIMPRIFRDTSHTDKYEI